jgi:hypothetical protein
LGVGIGLREYYCDGVWVILYVKSLTQHWRETE